MDIIHPIEAEETVIGIITSGKAEDAAWARSLSASDFHNPDCKALFEAFSGLYNARKTVNLPNVDDWLTRNVGADRAQRLMQTAMNKAREHALSAWTLSDNVDRVLEGSRRRGLMAIGEAICRGSTDPKRDIAGLIDDARLHLRNRIQSKFEWFTAGDAAIAAYEALENNVKPYPTGIADLDSVLCGGIHPGEFTIIGARPAVGKSAVLLQMACRCAEAGINTAYISLEMSKRQMGARMLASKSAANAGMLRGGMDISPKTWEHLSSALTLIGGSTGDRLQIVACGGMTIEEISREVQTLVDTGKCDVLFVDYLQLIRTEHAAGKDYERIGLVSRALKGLTIDHNIAVVAAAQVRRQDNGGTPRAPSLDELRGSGDMEQDADNVLLLHVPTDSDDYTFKNPSYNRFNGLFERLQNGQHKLMTIDVAKQRQGEAGRIWTIFNPSRMTFVDAERFMETNTK